MEGKGMENLKLLSSGKNFRKCGSLAPRQSGMGEDEN